VRKIRYMDENTLIKKSIEALMAEIGPIETIRFINMPRKKKVESVRRHRQWQKMLDKDQFFKEVFNS